MNEIVRGFQQGGTLLYRAQYDTERWLALCSRTGKTTELLRQVTERRNLGKRVAVIKCEKDTRYDLSAIVSHDGERTEAYAVPTLAAFRRMVRSH